MFQLTVRGERALRTWLARRPAWPAPLRDEIFVRFLAAERDGQAALLAQVERQEGEYRRYLTLVAGQGLPAAATATRRLAHEAALTHAEAHLAWLVRSRERLAAALARVTRSAAG